MKNGLINITTFDIFDTIREKYDIKDITWAKESGLKYSSRISEPRRMARLYREGKDPSIVGRAFPVNKCIMLFTGLKRILGGETLVKEMLELLKKTADRKERIILLSLMLEGNQEVTAEMFLVNLLQITVSSDQ